MKARKLDRLVQVERATIQDDGFSSVEVWGSHGAPIWAQRSDISDGEKARAGIVESTLATRFKIRWSSFSVGISPADRLVCEGVTFGINGIKEAEGRREWLEISCTARNDLS